MRLGFSILWFDDTEEYLEVLDKEGLEAEIFIVGITFQKSSSLKPLRNFGNINPTINLI